MWTVVSKGMLELQQKVDKVGPQKGLKNVSSDLATVLARYEEAIYGLGFREPLCR